MCQALVQTSLVGSSKALATRAIGLLRVRVSVLVPNGEGRHVLCKREGTGGKQMEKTRRKLQIAKKSHNALRATHRQGAGGSKRLSGTREAGTHNRELRCLTGMGGCSF